jgi:hypothetical protein
MWWLYQGDGVYLYVLPCFPLLLIVRAVDTMERSDFTGIRHNSFPYSTQRESSRKLPVNCDLVVNGTEPIVIAM